MASKAYDLWMNEIEQYENDTVGDRVGCFGYMTVDGKVTFYGWGRFVAIEERNLLDCVGNGFFSHLVSHIRIAKLDKGYNVDTTQAIILDEETTQKILDCAVVSDKDLEYVNVMRDNEWIIRY